MIVPPIIVRRDLPAQQRQAMDLMLRALFILDCAGETGPAARLSHAIDHLIDAPSAADMTAAEWDELIAQLETYQAAVTSAQDEALTLTIHG